MKLWWKVRQVSHQKSTLEDLEYESDLVEQEKTRRIFAVEAVELEEDYKKQRKKILEVTGKQQEKI